MENNVFTQAELEFMVQSMINERDNCEYLGVDDNIEFFENLISKLEVMLREMRNVSRSFEQVN